MPGGIEHICDHLRNLRSMRIGFRAGTWLCFCAFCAFLRLSGSLDSAACGEHRRTGPSAPNQLRVMEGAGPSAPPSPSENIFFALKRPRGFIVNQSAAYWIEANVLPFCLIAVLVPQLGIPEVALPQGMLASAGPVSRGVRLPIDNPSSERLRRICGGGTEQVQVIWHQHPSPDFPMGCLHPCLAQNGQPIVAGEDRFPIGRANSQEDNHWLIMVIVDWVVSRMFTCEIAVRR